MSFYKIASLSSRNWSVWAIAAGWYIAKRKMPTRMIIIHVTKEFYSEQPVDALKDFITSMDNHNEQKTTDAN